MSHQVGFVLTGGSGFIASHLAQALSAQGVRVLRITGRRSVALADLDNVRVVKPPQSTEELVDLFGNFGPVGVFHLAGRYRAEHSPQDLEDIVQGTFDFGVQVLEAAQQSGCKAFVSAGSVWQSSGATPGLGVNLYASLKNAFASIQSYYALNYGVRSINLRLSDTYGPGDTRKKILPLWAQAVRTGQKLDMTSGEQRISLLHVSDVVRGFQIAMERARQLNSAAGFEDFLLASDSTVSLRELAECFAQAIGESPQLNWGALAHRKNEVFTPDTAAPRLPGWAPEVPLVSGLRHSFAGSHRNGPS